MTEQKFCPRCAKPGVKAEIGGDLIWTCSDHGVIWKEPAISYSVDDTTGAIVSAVDNGDGTATVTDMCNGVANLTATGVSAEGLTVTDTQTVTVANVVAEQTLGSIKIAFDGGSAPASA